MSLSVVCNPEVLKFTEELLFDCSEMGAYAVGMVSALCWMEGRVPPFVLLEEAARCASVAEAVGLFRASTVVRSAMAREGGAGG